MTKPPEIIHNGARYLDRSIPLLGLNKSHLQRKYRQFFLDDDLILFTQRNPTRNPKRIPPLSPWPPRPFFCVYCFLDGVVFWVILIFFLGILYICIAPAVCIYILGSETGQVMAPWFFLYCFTSLLILLAANTRLLDSIETSDTHQHIVKRLVQRFGSHRYTMLLWDWGLQISSFEKCVAVPRSLKAPGTTSINKSKHDDKSVVFAPILNREDLLNKGWVVVRLARYPEPIWLIVLRLLSRVLLFGNKQVSNLLSELYQTWYFIRRWKDGAEAYARLLGKGLLAEGVSMPPVEYRSADLERESEGFLYTGLNPAVFE